jgi:tetratricopeptide (TPR) repeat protein
MSSKLFFRQEAYSELYPVFSRVRKLDPDNLEVRALEGKILFQEQKFKEAESIFNQLIQNGFNDSSVYYMNGLIYSLRGDRKKAISCFEKARELEDTFFLYWLKLGETKFLSGLDPEADLKKALALAPDNAWVLNQYGLYLFKKKEYESAREYFFRAHRQDKNEIDFCINLSLALFELGKKDEAFKVLDSENLANNHVILNHKGNLYVRENNFNRAIKEYEKALRLDPANPVYLENCAKACIEVDMIMRAEEYLIKLFDISPAPAVYNLIGYLALIQRDWIRAEIAFREGLEKDPDNCQLLINLSSLYLDRLDYAKAKENIEKVLQREPENKEAQRILMRIRQKSEVDLHCAACGRIWWVPKNIPIQSLGKIYGEPPADAPAGKCEKCGKIFCVGCAQEHLRENRFFCPDCNEFLKLSDDNLKFLLIERIKKIS